MGFTALWYAVQMPEKWVRCRVGIHREASEGGARRLHSREPSRGRGPAVEEEVEEERWRDERTD